MNPEPRSENNDHRERSWLSGDLVARNTIFNLVGQAAPMVIGIIVIPQLIGQVGMARFGLITLAWVILGYVGVFDLGLGRALTKVVAENVDRNPRHAALLVWTATLMLTALGTLAAILMLITVRPAVHQWLAIPPSLQSEAASLFRILAIATPAVFITTAFRGVLEAQQKFGFIAAVRAPTTALSFIVPLLISLRSPHLTPIIVSLVLIRVAGGCGYIVRAFSTLPELREMFGFHTKSAGVLLRFGGWLTVSNIVGPVMTYLDRFIIAALLTLEAVAYYATPYDVVINCAIIPGAIAGVLFPVLSNTMVHDHEKAGWFFTRGLKYVYAAIFPVAFAIFAFAPEGLNLWLGPAFEANSTAVARWLSLGLFVNALAYIPFALVQSAHRPDLTAKLHLFELPGYIALIWLLSARFGIAGVAAAWFIRAAADAAVLLYLAAKLLPRTVRSIRQVVLASVIAICVIVSSSLLPWLWLRVVMFLGVTLVASFAAWRYAFSPEEREWLLAIARVRRRSANSRKLGEIRS